MLMRLRFLARWILAVVVLSFIHPPSGEGAETGGKSAGWQALRVPGTWDDVAGIPHVGIAWYRCLVMVPADWKGRSVTLAVDQIDNAHEAFFNGIRIGGAGHFPPAHPNGGEA